MKILFVLALIGLGEPAYAKILPAGILDVVIIRMREDSTVDVICRNGNREQPSLSDLFAKLVCPNPTQSLETGMRLVTPREDDAFDVTCRDGSRVTASEEQILAGEICLPTMVPNLEAGTYRATEGYTRYFDQTVTPVFEAEMLTGLKIQLPYNAGSIDLICQGAVCRGRWSFGGVSQVEIKSAASYSYSQVDSQGKLVNTALFTK